MNINIVAATPKHTYRTTPVEHLNMREVLGLEVYALFTIGWCEAEVAREEYLEEASSSLSSSTPRCLGYLRPSFSTSESP